MDKRFQRRKEQIGDGIRAILKSKGWTQQDLADKTGYGKSYISEVLSGKYNVTVETLVVLEQALGQPVFEIAPPKGSFLG